MKRVLTIGDTHCGHKAGLTPPQWQNPQDKGDRYDLRQVQLQKVCWDFYTDVIRREGPFDAVLFNGDAVEGKGERSGGTELITSDRNQQVSMAEVCIRQALTAKTKLVMTYGTPSHVGVEEDWESAIAKTLGCKIGSHEWPRIEDVTFDMKHKVGSSSVPHGRHTAVAREQLWNSIWAEREGQPRAQCLLRSHVHYYKFNGDHRAVAMTLPALQAVGTKYGARQCSGLVDWGLVTWTIDKDRWSWAAHILDAKEARATARKLC
jgi:hypothetical protein